MFYAQYAHDFVNNYERYIVPQSVEIDLTNSCNQDCIYCNVTDYREENSDKTKNHHYHALIEKLSSWGGHTIGSQGGVQSITFVGGGEPTVRKGYEYLVEQSVDSGMLTSIITNGTKLDKLSNIPIKTVKKIAWIGVDVDSGDKDIYEEVRRSKRVGLFDQVKDNIKWLVQINARVDLKVLLHPLTVALPSLEKTFLYAVTTGVRMIYFRLALMNDGRMYEPEHFVYEAIDSLSKKHNVKVKVNKTRLIERNYTKCHALYMMPVFAADGKVYLCCENRGNQNYMLGDWLRNDFRKDWCSITHRTVFDKIDSKMCKPCRPHIHNVGVTEAISSESYYQSVFL